MNSYENKIELRGCVYMQTRNKLTALASPEGIVSIGALTVSPDTTDLRGDELWKAVAALEPTCTYLCQADEGCGVLRNSNPHLAAVLLVGN
ncbi:hypothetical protein J6590_038358 [Homalodisca vitripennis]|nr:hypothetical protein J6590_038358 [Homalodisca vitripennis]